jgi:hypothetical protein
MGSGSGSAPPSDLGSVGDGGEMSGDPGRAPTSSRVTGTSGTGDAGESVNVGGDVNSATSVAGGSSVSGSGGANVNLSGIGDGSATRDAQRSVIDTQHSTDGRHAEAKVNTELGADGRSAVIGGRGEQHADALVGEADVYGTAEDGVESSAGSGTLRGDVRAGGFREAGIKDPEMRVSDARSGAEGEEGKQMGRVQSAEADANRVHGYANDPSGSAKTAGRDAMRSEVHDRAPQAADIEADANVAKQAVQDPATAGEARAEVAVDAEVSAETEGLPKVPK